MFKFIRLSTILLVGMFFLVGCGGGGGSSDELEVTNNNTPTVNAGADKSVKVNESTTITGVANDSDGSIVAYEWKEGNKLLATTASFDYLPTVEGNHTLTLTVTDDDGETASDSMVVRVIDDVSSTLSNGLIAYYKFDGNAKDSSGKGNNGVEHGGVTYVDGVIGKAGKFDGVSNIKTPIELIGTEENQYITISFWGLAEDKAHSTFVTNYNHGDGSNSISLNGSIGGIVGGFSGYWWDGFCYKYTGINLLDEITNRTNSCGVENSFESIYDYDSTPVNPTKWHYYSITYNNMYEKIYIDGNKVIEKKLEANLIGGENGVERYPRDDSDYDRFLNIGMGNNAFNYSQSDLNQYTLKGLIDDLRIYRRTLSEEEIQELYEMGNIN